LLAGVVIMNIKIKRIYEEADVSDGFRILVDRLWPRGVSKGRAKLAYWAKELSPSNELRKWYRHDAGKWEEFKRRYFKELESKPEKLTLLKNCLENEVVTFIYSSRETKLNNATALKE
jgi:uncharacterized protein YeaO (DUF488 family)